MFSSADWTVTVEKENNMKRLLCTVTNPREWLFNIVQITKSPHEIRIYSQKGLHKSEINFQRSADEENKALGVKQLSLECPAG